MLPASAVAVWGAGCTRPAQSPSPLHLLIFVEIPPPVPSTTSIWVRSDHPIWCQIFLVRETLPPVTWRWNSFPRAQLPPAKRCLTQLEKCSSYPPWCGLVSKDPQTGTGLLTRDCCPTWITMCNLACSDMNSTVGQAGAFLDGRGKHPLTLRRPPALYVDRVTCIFIVQ